MNRTNIASTSRPVERAGARWTVIGLWLVRRRRGRRSFGQRDRHRKTAVRPQSGQRRVGRPAVVVLADAGFPDPAVEQVLVQTRDGSPLGAPGAAAVSDVSAALRRLGEVADVAAPATTADGTAALIAVTLDVGDRTGTEADAAAQDAVRPVLAAVAGVQASHPGLRVVEAGDSSLNAVVGAQLDEDFRRAELLSLPVTLLILLVAFGALLAAGVPLLLGLTAVGGTLGLVGLVSQLPGGREHLQRRALDRHGRRGRLRPVLRAPGTGGTPLRGQHAGVGRAGRGHLRPGRADLGDLGRRRDGWHVPRRQPDLHLVRHGHDPCGRRLRARFADRASGDTGAAGSGHRAPAPARCSAGSSAGPTTSRVWGAIARRVVGRPGLSLALGTGVLLALAVPALGMTTALPGTESLSRDSEVVRAYDSIAAAFPQEGSTDTVAVWREDGRPLDAGAVRRATDALAGRLSDPGRAGTLELSPDGTVARLAIASIGSPSSPEAVKP